MKHVCKSGSLTCGNSSLNLRSPCAYRKAYSLCEKIYQSVAFLQLGMSEMFPVWKGWMGVTHTVATGEHS